MKSLVIVLLSVFLAFSVIHGYSQDLDSLRARDIETAGYYELRSWAEELDLSVVGSRAELQARVADHYGVEIDTAESESTSRTVRIETAEDMQYFTVSEVEQEHIRLSGGVTIELIDREDDSRHRIEADEIVLNQDREILSAYGTVTYEIDRGEDIERFEGQSLTVELDSWAGSFLYGTSRRPREIEGDTLDFRFSGSAITRSAEDVIILDDGVITSSSADPPNYSITAERIWVLEPGDWALENAVLNVGRVPLLYFPYFFHPGRPNVLNFSFGVRDRDGAYVQTTYYIAGRREDDTEPLSVLRLAGSGDETERVREGLFLRPVREGETARSDENTVRIFADAYSNLGGLLGIDAQLSGTPLLENTDFFAGIGATRLQYGIGSGLDRRTTFTLDQDGNTRQYWSSSQFPGLAAPFRFAVDLSTGLSVAGLSLSLDMPLYSDPYFERDLLNRFEGIDWGGLVGLSDERDDPPGVRSSLDWRVSTSYSPSMDSLSPWVTQARIRRADATVRWDRRDVPDELLEDFESDTRVISPPAETFFYPSILTLPQFSGRVSGTLLDSAIAQEDSDSSSVRDSGRLRDPAFRSDNYGEGDPEQTSSFAEEGGHSSLRIPEPRQVAAVARPEPPFEYRLGYTVNPSVRLLARTRDEQWQQPADVDWDLAYWEEDRRVSGSLSWDSEYLDSLVALDTRLSVNDRYRNVFGFSEEIASAEREDLQERAFGGNSTTLDSTTELTVLPLDQVALFEGTAVEYSLDMRLVDRSFEALIGNEPVYAVTPLTWDRDGIRDHNVGATIAANTLNERQSLALNYELPPREERGTADLRLLTGPLESRLRTGYTRREATGQDPERIVYDPLRVTETLTVGERTELEQRFEYDMNDTQMESARSAVTAGDLSARFDMTRSESFEFRRDEERFGWIGQENEKLRPTSVSLDLDTSVEPEPSWRGRIRSEFDLTGTISADLQRFTNSSLDVEAGLNINIFRFLDLDMRARSSNEQIYQYIPGLAEQVGRDTRNVFVDLARSFNFFNRRDREFSGFNIRQLEIDAIHDLGDWDLTVSYRGNPTQRNDESIEWRSTMNVSLEWRPIPEISRSFDVEDGEVDW